ncbi:hypothetical protein A3A93_00705 [Candidatus Roizmanbacteria bacterium RIFCSPLOWO2_01_FULL_38_12]|uniref:Membrane protein 6-pyruvoyl-tetrahydropterin synthase-related domain-containing protein n=1 Tax=Candidatus Roizmanbacteria bacterium RIFCSPLOWO2_01_FULL_38_12 TaxID=1802061 RepID=A0A1F7J084_9BACT|nr:MAG: hypothetical protein A3F59_01380 [Candidatus Roizmanbacteria bacterium RIFCSPHIGHO2_12_FULL_38_13]OGK49015.1 MAG: hypothetical protein A3A93_00705 [Candidatus Roizmanbacteria bacterium RIFCSPLOWO2_01_FULL_38_12]
MERVRSEISFILVLASIISVFFIFDLFIHRGQPTTFDGPTHIANIAQIYGALSDGEFPARWGDGFARYGMPIPIFAQQVTSYLGAFLTFITHDVVLSYNLVVFMGLLLSTVLMYIFLRLYVGKIPAVTGAFLFHFAPYRIMNVYIRGALPEFFSSIFMLGTLIGLHLLFEKKSRSGYFVLTISLALLLLTHPFMFVVASIVFVLYGLFLWIKNRQKAKMSVIVIFLLILGFGIAAYFLVPLLREIKYFYYGQSADHYAKGQFLTIQQFIVEQWFYFRHDVSTRYHYHLGGVIEGGVFIISVITFGLTLIRKKKITVEHIFMAAGLLYIFFMLPISEFLYENIRLLGNIQHPWRMMSGYILIPPILLAFLLERFKYQKLILYFLIIIVAFIRFPQLYGKNYTEYPQNTYFVTDYNLHATVMNTVWTGEVRSYPYKKQKAEIIEGKGKIVCSDVKNAERQYLVEAQSEVRLADYTFYFPGWRAYVDGTEVLIEFQDPEYRGVITYKIPQGQHQVTVKFTETKVRQLGNAVTLLSLAAFVGGYYIIRRYKII